MKDNYLSGQHMQSIHYMQAREITHSHASAWDSLMPAHGIYSLHAGVSDTGLSCQWLLWVLVVVVVAVIGATCGRKC